MQNKISYTLNYYNYELNLDLVCHDINKNDLDASVEFFDKLNGGMSNTILKTFLATLAGDKNYFYDSADVLCINTNWDVLHKAYLDSFKYKLLEVRFNDFLKVILESNCPTFKFLEHGGNEDIEQRNYEFQVALKSFFKRAGVLETEFGVLIPYALFEMFKLNEVTF